MGENIDLLAKVVRGEVGKFKTLKLSFNFSEPFLKRALKELQMNCQLEVLELTSITVLEHHNLIDVLCELLKTNQTLLKLGLPRTCFKSKEV